MERCESGLCSRYFWQSALRFISCQVLRVICEGVGRNCFLKEGLSDGLSYFTSQKSKETKGNAITHPHSYPLAPGHFLNFLNTSKLRSYILPLTFTCCSCVLNSSKIMVGGVTMTAFSSPSQSLNSLYSDL